MSNIMRNTINETKNKLASNNINESINKPKILLVS